MTILSVAGLAKRFAGNAVLRGIDLSVEKGERIAILGASGSGKPTLLRCLNFMEMPDAGTVTLDGKAVGPGGKYRESELIAVRQRVGMVFQQFNLFPHLTVGENIMMSPRVVKGESPHALREEAHALLAKVGLADKFDAWPDQLSGGQQQRVALARALVIRPRCLLLDEPLSNLDAKLREEMQIELRQIQRTVGTTTILVTHDQAEAMALSDRIVVMTARPGKIKTIINVNEPHPRSPDFMLEPRFSELRNECYSLLRDEIRATMAAQRDPQVAGA